MVDSPYNYDELFSFSDGSQASVFINPPNLNYMGEMEIAFDDGDGHVLTSYISDAYGNNGHWEGTQSFLSANKIKEAESKSKLYHYTLWKSPCCRNL